MLAFASLVLLAQPFSTVVQNVRLKQFHLQQDSFPLFAVNHFIPPMYSFANEIWYTNKLVDFAEIESQEGAADVFHYWLNHYPTRFVSFDIIGRQKFFDDDPPRYLYVRSKYRDSAWRTIYELRLEDGVMSLNALKSDGAS